MPFQDNGGQQVTTMQEWNRSRNQQRNWETVNQIIALRTLPEDISMPVHEKDEWSFEFTVDVPSTIEIDGDPIGALLQDCQDVPMLTGLDESRDIGACLDPPRNINFDILDDK